MKCFIELWSAKESWNNLSKAERGEYLKKLGPHIQELTENGVEIVCWGSNDDSVSYKANYDFFAVWKFPNQEMVEEFEELVEGAGWYNYFEQVNISGESVTPNDVIPKLIEL